MEEGGKLGRGEWGCYDDVEQVSLDFLTTDSCAEAYSPSILRCANLCDGLTQRVSAKKISSKRLRSGNQSCWAVLPSEGRSWVL